MSCVKRNFRIWFPCDIGDEVYRVWTVGGKRVIATFIITSYVINEKGCFVYVKSKNQQGTIRVWKLSEFGKTIFIDKQSAERFL